MVATSESLIDGLLYTKSPNVIGCVLFQPSQIAPCMEYVATFTSKIPLVRLREQNTGKSHSSSENLWFPANFPLSQPIEKWPSHVDKYSSTMVRIPWHPKWLVARIEHPSRQGSHLYSLALVPWLMSKPHYRTGAVG